MSPFSAADLCGQTQMLQNDLEKQGKAGVLRWNTRDRGRLGRQQVTIGPRNEAPPILRFRLVSGWLGSSGRYADRPVLGASRRIMFGPALSRPEREMIAAVAAAAQDCKY